MDKNARKAKKMGKEWAQGCFCWFLYKSGSDDNDNDDDPRHDAFDSSLFRYDVGSRTLSFCCSFVFLVYFCKCET